MKINILDSLFKHDIILKTEIMFNFQFSGKPHKLFDKRRRRKEVQIKKLTFYTFFHLFIT